MPPQRDIIVRRNTCAAHVGLRWARSATKHRISRDQSRYVIERCGLRFEKRPPIGAPDGTDPRLVYLGDGPNGEALEVMAVECSGSDLLVIHAMPLRERYRKMYEEAKEWQR